MSEIEKSLTFLQDSIPQWLHDITGVQEKVTAMQDDLVRMAVSMSPFVKPTTDSVASMRPEKMDAIVEDAAPFFHGAQTDPVGSRKRKTLSVLSGRASGPSRYRRTMVVVSYDGGLQKSFELLVRAIGTGRNLLRKAKMEAKMNELAALAGSSEEEDEADDDDDDKAIMAKISYRPRMSSMRTRAAARRGGAVAPVALFDTTDKMLEDAQSLCEKAAHVTLRDGDCRKELESVCKSLAHVLETAKAAVTKCNTARPQAPQEHSSHHTSASSLSSVEPSYKKHFPQVSLPPRELQSQPKNMLPSIIHTGPQIMDIEVDDDEEDDEPDFVMPVRFTSRFAARA